MSDEHQPEAVWVFPAKKKSNRGRIWLIVGLAVAAVVIVGVMLFLFLPRPEAPQPTASPSMSSSPSPTASTTPTPTATPTPSPNTTSAPTQPQTPPAAPKPMPPPASDPGLSVFAEKVQPWLDDAVRGLGFVGDLSAQDAVQVIDTLQQDAQRLSDSVAPSSISSKWYPAVGQYSARLGELRSAAEGGSVSQTAVNNSAAALKELRALIGL